MCIEMSTLTPKQVGDEMSIYTFRPGKPVLKRELVASISKYYCFDKGHLRITSSIPPGFVPVPEQVILQFFGTKYSINIRKLERSIEDYYKGYTHFKQGGRRPKRPTIRSLYLETPSEFELVLRPLVSFYCTELRQNFGSILNAVENKQNWKTQVNALAVLAETKRKNRWVNSTDEGNHKFMYVRLRNFSSFEPVPVKSIPAFIAPYPVAPERSGESGESAGLGGLGGMSLEDKDVDMLERTNMGRSRKYRKVLMYMSPWKDCIRASNPFQSKAYQTAYILAQHSFELRYNEFKKGIEKRRAAYRKEWASYKAFKDDQKSLKPKLPFVDKPDPVEFDKEWREFIFGMKQEMKNIEFQPIRGKQGVATETKIINERKTMLVPVPSLQKPARVIETKVIPHTQPTETKPPLLLPEIILNETDLPVVHEMMRTSDPTLLLIEQDFKYSKRIVVK